jgi:hypothetical protein
MAKQKPDWTEDLKQDAQNSLSVKAAKPRRLSKGGVKSRPVCINFNEENYRDFQGFLSQVSGGISTGMVPGMKGKFDSRQLQPGPFLNAMVDLFLHHLLPAHCDPTFGKDIEKKAKLFFAIYRRQGRFVVDADEGER